MNISEIRQKYPQYNDLSDEQIVQGLHKKFYSDMPYDEFTSKIGLAADKPNVSFGEVGEPVQMPESTGGFAEASMFGNPDIGLKNRKLDIKTIQDKVLKPAVRMAIEGGGTALAEIAALPTMNPYAILAAGTAGYAASKSAADTILGEGPKDLRELAEKFPQDLKTGAMYSMGGQIAAPILLGVAKGGIIAKDWAKNALTKKGVEMAAGKKLIANTSFGDIYARNVKEARELEEAIPGLKFTTAQQSNIPDMVKLERATTRAGSANPSVERVSQNTEALSRFFETKFPGKGIDDVLPVLRETQAGLVAEAAEKQKASDALALLMKSEAPETSGESILKTLERGKSQAKAEASKLYAKVPEDTKIPIDPMLKKFKGVTKKIGKYETSENVPDIVTRVLSKEKAVPTPQRAAGFTARDVVTVNGKKYATIKDLQGLDIELKDEIRAAQANNAKGQYIKRLVTAKKAVSKAIEKAETSDAALKEANQFFRKEVVEKYKHGPVGQILTRGPRGEASKVPLYQIPGKIWKTGDLTAAQQFVKAVGKDAVPLMRDHAAYDLVYGYGKPGFIDAVDKTRYLETWMTKNKKLIDGFGLRNDFSSIAKAQEAASAAAKNVTAFEQGAAYTALSSDTNKAIARALKPGRIKEGAQELYDLVKGSQEAKAGLQKSLADHILNETQLTAEILAKDFKTSYAKFAAVLKKYEPAMKILYQDSPDKLKALKQMNDALRVSVRTSRSPLGGGSDTAENLATALKSGVSGMNLLYRPWVLAKGAYNFLNRINQSQVDAVMMDALMNPSTAERIIKLRREAIAWRHTPKKIKIDEHATQVFDDLFRQIIQRRKLYVGAATGGAAAMGGEAINGLQR